MSSTATCLNRKGVRGRGNLSKVTRLAPTPPFQDTPYSLSLSLSLSLFLSFSLSLFLSFSLRNQHANQHTPSRRAQDCMRATRIALGERGRKPGHCHGRRQGAEVYLRDLFAHCPHHPATLALPTSPSDFPSLCLSLTPSLLSPLSLLLQSPPLPTVCGSGL